MDMESFSGAEASKCLDSRYMGQFQDSYMQGRGRYEWTDGKVYEGEWDKDEMHGSGVYVLPDGRKYVGDFFRGKKQGFGTMEEADGVYAGNWKAGLKHGTGKFTYKDGRRLEAKWANNVVVETIRLYDPSEDKQAVKEAPVVPEKPVIHSQSQETTPSSYTIQPEITFTTSSQPTKIPSNPSVSQPVPPPLPSTPLEILIKKESKVSKQPASPQSLVQTRSSASVAREACEDLEETDRVRNLRSLGFPKDFEVGDFVSSEAKKTWEKVGWFSEMQREKTRGSLYCHGMLATPTALYKGEVDLHHTRHGRGLTLSQGSIFEGTWLDNQLHGLGRCIEPDGSVYTGYWVMGHKHGYGVYRHIRGILYAGDWVLDQQHGLGYEHGGMVTYLGAFQNGYKHGFGRLNISKEGVYEGNFQQDIREGYGTMVFLDGKKYAGEWHEDRMEGKGIKVTSGSLLAGKTEKNEGENAERFTFRPNSGQFQGSGSRERLTTRPKSPSFGRETRF